MAIVRSTYRYKPPPRKRKAVALEVPAVVTIPDKKQRKMAARSNPPDEAKVAAPPVTPPAPATPAASPRSPPASAASGRGSCASRLRETTPTKRSPPASGPSSQPGCGRASASPPPLLPPLHDDQHDDRRGRRRLAAEFRCGSWLVVLIRRPCAGAGYVVREQSVGISVSERRQSKERDTDPCRVRKVGTFEVRLIKIGVLQVCLDKISSF